MRLSNEIEELLGRNPQDRASIYDVDDPRPERGTMIPLYTRLMRFLQGDPIQYQVATSTGPANAVQLGGNYAGARSCVIYVAGGSVIYRVDGTPPAAAGDQTIQEGSTVTLTGKPTMLGFVFAGSAGAVTLYATYYD
jgi:hypothetical protein